MAHKKKWSPKAKLEIALLALKGEMTINQLCQNYKVAPSQVHNWKKLLLEEGSQLFEKSGKSSKQKSSAIQERTESQLYAKIGQLTMERDFLKKAWGRLPETGEEK